MSACEAKARAICVPPLCLLDRSVEAVLVIGAPVSGAHFDLEGVVVALHAERNRSARRPAGPQLLVEIRYIVQHLAVQRLQDVAALQAGTIGRAAIGYAADHELAPVLDRIEAEPRARRCRDAAGLHQLLEDRLQSV